MARSFDEAYSYCNTLELSGESDWRVPSLTELQTLVDESTKEPAIDLTAFPGAPNDYVWTSSLFAADLSSAWTVRFNDGYTWYYPVATPYSVRCVR